MQRDQNNFTLILASSSPYRARLLQRLQVPFKAIAANIDERPQQNETPISLVKRLSEQKAQVVANKHQHDWVIGSDQVAVCEGQIIGKPVNHENAIQQLKAFSGKTVEFLTGIAITNKSLQKLHYKLSSTSVVFRPLSLEMIEIYLQKDQPYDCAGSFKVESLGILLFEKIISLDPTCLEGLPLITLCDLFAIEGINLLDCEP